MHLLHRIVFHKPDAAASMSGTGSDIPILAEIDSCLQLDLPKTAVSALFRHWRWHCLTLSSRENVQLGPRLRFPLFYIWLKTCTITFIGQCTKHFNAQTRVKSVPAA